MLFNILNKETQEKMILLSVKPFNVINQDNQFIIDNATNAHHIKSMVYNRHTFKKDFVRYNGVQYDEKVFIAKEINKKVIRNNKGHFVSSVKTANITRCFSPDMDEYIFVVS